MDTWNIFKIFLLSPQVLQMCTELQSFAPRSLVFAFPECFEVIFFAKRRNKWGNYWGFDAWTLSSSKWKPALRPSIHRPPVSQTLAWRQGLAARSQVRNMHLSRNVIWKLFNSMTMLLTRPLSISDGAPMKDVRRCCASYMFCPPTAGSLSYLLSLSLFVQ